MGADGYAPLCFPCHAEKSMVVGTDHDLRVTAPTAVNRDGRNAETSGVCGACHAMHRAPEARALWNRGFGEGRDEGSRACTSCHRAGNDQGAHVPPRAEAHLVNFPGRGLVSRLFTITRTVAAGSASIPVFAEDGSQCRQRVSLLRLVPRRAPLGGRRHKFRFRRAGRRGYLEQFPARARHRPGSDACARSATASRCVEHYRNYHFPEGK